MTIAGHRSFLELRAERLAEAANEFLDELRGSPELETTIAVPASI
jgi:hypothetical protein